MVASVSTRALAHVANAAPPVPQRFDVVIGGGGPGGMAAAALAARRGAHVLVLEARPAAGSADAWGQRWQQAIVRSPSIDVLADIGIADELFAHPLSTFTVAGRSSGLIAHGPLERSLAVQAREAGADLRFDAAVDGVRQLDEGVAVYWNGHDVPLHARTYIDASGGRSPALAPLGLLRRSTGNSQTYVARRYEYLPVAAGDAARPVRSVPGLDEQFRTYRATMVNHPEHGAHVSIAMQQPGALDGADQAALDAFHARITTERLGNPGAPLTAAYVARLEAGQAPAARVGDVVLIGDSVARKLPTATAGVNGALQDAARAADAVLVTGPRREGVLDAFNAATMDYHRSGRHWN